MKRFYIILALVFSQLAIGQQDNIQYTGPRCDQFETPIQDPSSKSGWKCINQAVEQQKRETSFCEPNHDLTECVTPDGYIYKLERSVNQSQRAIVPHKKQTQDILPDPQILKKATHQ